MSVSRNTKERHLRVRLIMQQEIQRMVDGFFLAAVLLVPVEVQRQACHRFRQDADAGIHRRHLHGGAFIDPPCPRGRAAKEEAVGAAGMCGSGAYPWT